MYKKGSQGLGKHYDFVILDLICLQVAFILAFVVRHGFSSPYKLDTYRIMAISIMLIDAFVINYFETLKNVLKRGYYKEFKMTLKNVCLVELIGTFYLFALQEGEAYSRITFFLMGILYAILSYIVRVGWKSHLENKMFNGGKRSLLIVTVDSMVSKVVENIQNYNYEMFSIAGIAVINRDMKGEEIDGVSVVANKDTVADYVCRQWVDEVLINLPQDTPYSEVLVEQFIEMGVVVHTKIAKSNDSVGQKQFVERIGNYTVLTTSMNYARAGQLFMKRAFDIIIGLIGCLFTGILCILLGPVIYFQSPGPIFFSQTRVGKNGKPFKIYKFRSMDIDAENKKKELMKENRNKDGMMFKLDYDPRIIGCKQLPNGKVKKGIGNYIRDFSLDEFPQFLNVLLGDMSVVGTRPPTMDEWEKYDLHHRARLATKPGITGMWQVSGRNNITDFEEVVKLDTKYISEWSMKLDLKIVLKTVCVVFKREGAM